MRDRELWRKEGHECWPLAAAPAAVFLLVGLVLLRLEAVRSQDGRWALGVSLGSGGGMPASGLEPLAMAMTGLAIVGGSLLALRQFLVPTLAGEWGFLLHRGITRGRVLAVKVGTAFALLGGALAAVWSVLILIAGLPRALPYPPAAGTWREGLLLLCWGGIAYLAVADACLSSRRWYTTKLVAPLFALGGFALALLASPAELLACLLTLGALCGLSLSATFLTHEFEGGA